MRSTRKLVLLSHLLIQILVSNQLSPLLSKQTIALRPVRLELPASPASVISTDLNGDGRRDLVVVLVYPEWVEIGESRTEGLIELMEVVPALYEKREARAWLATEHGGYRPLPAPLSLPLSVISAEAGPPGVPVLLLTDEGLSALGLSGETLTIEPLVAEPPVGAGGGSYLAGLDLVQDLDGNGSADVLLPAQEGPAVHRTTTAGLAREPSARLTLPGDVRRAGRVPSRVYPIPRVEDLDGDRLPDLLVRRVENGVTRAHVLRGLGEGRFADPVMLDLERLGVKTIVRSREGVTVTDEERELAFLGDLDGDGHAEVVTREEIDTGKSEFKQGKKPHLQYRFYRMRELIVATEPYHQAEVVGHAFHIESGPSDVAAFQDLDGDGRKDLVTVTLDVSMFQLLKVLTTKRISLGLEFHVYAQGADGTFRLVSGQDLSETLRLDLHDLRLGNFAQFQGDFDGDGRTDFVHLGRGKTVTVHRGQPGGRYPEKPDLALQLTQPIVDLALVKVEDLDGDGLSDLAITRPGTTDEPGVATPVGLELYLTGTGR